MANPRVTVLMGVYNSEPYLAEAVESILNQSFTDFEFLIINDGSTDNSPTILADYAGRDARIVLNPNPTNIGHANSLNRGLKLARGEYIARMDSDDISLPNRLLRQVEFMDAHPAVGVCGTWYRYFGGVNEAAYPPPANRDIQTLLFFASALAHPSVMIRQQVLEQHHLAYQPDFDPAEDYALWSEMAKVTALANIPEILLHYRVHGSQLTSVKRAIQNAGIKKVRLMQVRRLGIEPTADEATLHQQIIQLEKPITKDLLIRADAWLQKLRSANRQANVFPEPQFSTALEKKWYDLCRAALDLGGVAWQRYWSSPLSRSGAVPAKRKLKFWLLTLQQKIRN